MYIVAMTTPISEKDPEYDGMYFRMNEVEELAKSMKGKPVLFEHDAEMKIGKIIECFVIYKALFSILYIDKTLTGRWARKMVRCGITTEVSLGHDVILKTIGNKTNVISKKGIEISICIKGARDNCIMLAYLEDEDEIIKNTVCRNNNKIVKILDELYKNEKNKKQRLISDLQNMKNEYISKNM